MSVQVSYKKQFTLGLLFLLIILVTVEGISHIWWHNIETCAFEQSDVYADLHPEKKRQMCIQTYEVQYSVSNIDPNQHFSTININTEGFRGKDISPLTLQEAQLMEKPVIATNVGGVPELIQNEKTGFLVEPNETSKLEECLAVLIEDEKKRKVMGKNGREFIKEKFSWEVITKQFADVMKNNI